MEISLNNIFRSEWFPYVFILSIFIFGLYLNKTQSKKLFGVLQQQAFKRGGMVKKGSILYYPRLCFNFEGLEISVYSTQGGKSSPPYTHFECAYSIGEENKMSIRRENFVIKIDKKLGLKDITLNNSAFDDAYIVQGKNEMNVRNYLTFDLQSKLLTIKDDNPIVKLQAMSFSMHVPKMLNKEEEYDRIIDVGIEMIRKVKELF